MARVSKRAGKSAKPSTALRLDHYLPYRLGVAASDVFKVIAPYYRRLGLNMPELAVLSVLAEEAELTQQTIVERTVMEKFAVSRAARALIDRGLVRTSSHATDGRSYYLALTRSGRELYDRVAPMSLAYEAKLAEIMGAAAMDDIKQALHHLQEAAKLVAKSRQKLLSPYVDAGKTTTRPK
ncbi:MAG: MarR family transcriptional regulator [Hyphomonadaceae bacterium]|nr:MarR family transcriptional regulator [Hyphomonadaceae bacterium]